MTIASLILASTILAQDVPLPPKPAEGPSLEVTMKFIKDQLNGQGKVGTIHTSHNIITGKDSGPWKYSWEVSTDFEASSCQMSWRQFFQWPNPAATDEYRLSLSLREVSRLEVLPLREQYNRNAAKRGTPESVSETSPEVYSVTVYMAPGRSVHGNLHRTHVDESPTDEDYHQTNVQFQFLEEQLAHRVANALVHAVELCGGGSKDPF
jgi:hypothetical protein